MTLWDKLNREIVDCRACPRLVAWREQVAREKRKSFASDEYWGRAVPNFGDPEAKRLIVGLAPAAHGANRTGRMFTGDRSGDWLYRALHRAGLANQPTATDAGDGLELKGVAITAMAHCAPPDNKPTPDELSNCQGFLREILLGRDWHAVLCLGSLAWEGVLKLWEIKPKPKFQHGSIVRLEKRPVLIGSYHPSQQNTFTGRLTEAMLDEVMLSFSRECR